jgi:hypothetical protein
MSRHSHPAKTWRACLHCIEHGKACQASRRENTGATSVGGFRRARRYTDCASATTNGLRSKRSPWGAGRHADRPEGGRARRFQRRAGVREELRQALKMARERELRAMSSQLHGVVCCFPTRPGRAHRVAIHPAKRPMRSGARNASAASLLACSAVCPRPGQFVRRIISIVRVAYHVLHAHSLLEAEPNTRTARLLEWALGPQRFFLQREMQLHPTRSRNGRSNRRAKSGSRSRSRPTMARPSYTDDG